MTPEDKDRIEEIINEISSLKIEYNTSDDFQYKRRAHIMHEISNLQDEIRLINTKNNNNEDR